MTKSIDTAPLSNRLPAAVTSIPPQCFALAVFFWVYHEFLRYSMKELSINLGAVTFHRHFVPLYALPWIDLSAWVLPASLVLMVFLLLCRRVFLQSSVSTPSLLGISMVFFVAIGVSVAMIDGYRDIDNEPLAAFLEPYTRTGLEYYGDVPTVSEMGVISFLRDYAKPELFSTLSGHTQTHPPGGVLFLWLVSQVFGHNLLSASVATVVFTSLTVIPIYLLGRELYGGTVARLALAFFLITPNFVMFTATSMDGPFSVFPILSVFLFFRAQAVKRRGLHAILTGISLACGMFMTYSTVFIGVFFGVVGLLTLIGDRGRFNAMWRVLAIAGLVFAGCFVLLFLLTHFNLLEALWVSIKKDEAGVGTGYESIGHYLHLSVANLFAFLIGIGIPLTVVWLRQIGQTIADRHHGKPLDVYVAGFAAGLLFIAFSTLYTMEVERIWIFMAPFIVIPAARYISQRPCSADFYWVSGLLCVQLIVSEVTLYTYW